MSTPLYKLAPVTASTAEFLAGVYGASSIHSFAKSLPRGAKILDVGAGNSELGLMVAGLRPDIVWTNLDINYTPAELVLLNRDAPLNLTYQYGDILLSDNLPEHKYDIVYAFWILPHIGLEEPTLISVGLANLLKLLENGQASKLTVGPLLSQRSKDNPNRYPTTTLSKYMSQSILHEIAKSCMAPIDQVAGLRAMNRAGLTTLKNGQRTGQTPTRLGLWDYRHREYVKVLSLRGLLLTARFRWYLVIEKAKASSKY